MFGRRAVDLPHQILGVGTAIAVEEHANASNSQRDVELSKSQRGAEQEMRHVRLMELDTFSHDTFYDDCGICWINLFGLQLRLQHNHHTCPSRHRHLVRQ